MQLKQSKHVFFTAIIAKRSLLFRMRPWTLLHGDAKGLRQPSFYPDLAVLFFDVYHFTVNLL